MTFGTTPLSTTTIGANQFPASAVGVPNEASGNFTALQGVNEVTDANSNKLASALIAEYPLIPTVIQSTNNKSTGSVASLAKAFATNNTSGNTIVVVCGVGNGTAPTISDTASNTYTQAAQINNSTALNVAVFYATNIAAGANTVTVNNGGTTASIVMEIYEVQGFLASVPSQPIKTATNTGSSATASAAAISPSIPNTYAFAAVGIGTAAQTITAGSGWNNDSGQQNPTTPAGLFSFISMSQFLGGLKSVTPQATFTSEPWAIAVATFRPIVRAVEGTVKQTVAQSGGAVPYHNITAASTNFTNVKTSACQCYGIDMSNTSASVIYVKLYDKASTPGTGDTPKKTFQVPANATVLRVFPMGLQFSTGFGWAATGAIADNDNTAIAASCAVDFELDS